MSKEAADRLRESAQNEQTCLALNAYCKTVEAENERLRSFEVAFNEWHEKTEWVQENKGNLFKGMLGMHRADCLRLVIKRLTAELSAERALRMQRADRAVKAEKELAALRAQEPVIPEGYQLVPKEPTDEMQWILQGHTNFDETEERYEALLAAAPQPSQPNCQEDCKELGIDGEKK